jgi:Holliday junction resolvase RusA-like endonuclease
MNYIHFFVPGSPRAKQSFRYDGNGRGHTDLGVKSWQDWISIYAKKEMIDKEIFSKPTYVSLKFRLPTKRRVDIDNLSKCVLDGLNGIVQKDDCQVHKLILEKQYSRVDPGVIIYVEEIA